MEKISWRFHVRNEVLQESRTKGIFYIQ